MSTKPAATASLKRVGLLAEHRRESTRTFLRLRAAPVATLITLLVIGIALLLPSLLNHLQRTLTTGVLALQSEPSISVYLKLAASKDDVKQVSEQILQLADVGAIEVITPAQALAQLGETAGLNKDLLATFDDEVSVPFSSQNSASPAKPRNPLPTTLVVTPSASTDGSEMLATTAERLAAEIRAIDSVEIVMAEGAWLTRLHALAQIIRRSAQLLAVLMAVGLLTAIGNTVRLSVEQRRDEIRVSKLIGASNGYIARPFLYAGLFLGLGGGLVAWLLQLVVVGLVGHEVNQFLALYTTQANSVAASQITLFLQQAAQDLKLLLSTGAALGWLAAFVASHRAITACEP